MSYEAHQREAARSVRCALLTVSDTRTPETDTSGATMRSLLEEAGHAVVDYAIVPDEPDRIRTHLAGLIERDACDVILISGGTGIAPRDRTYEAVAGLLDKRLDGFGELFRMLSYEEIGSGAMLSRAVAGLYAGRAVFCMPGSTSAVRLAMTRLIIPELGHIVRLLGRGGVVGG
jgi:molybdenum cofactor biosynthesis protein B